MQSTTETSPPTYSPQKLHTLHSEGEEERKRLETFYKEKIAHYDERLKEVCSVTSNCKHRKKVFWNIMYNIKQLSCFNFQWLRSAAKNVNSLLCKNSSYAQRNSAIVLMQILLELNSKKLPW
jgi:hypothetical protein